jgi:hypothetical protein
VAALVAAVVVAVLREWTVTASTYEESEGEEDQVLGYAAELHWWDTHTQMGPEGTLIPREMPEAEAEGPVPITHPTRHLVELQPDPALEEEEEESSEEEIPEVVSGWGDSAKGGRKRKWEGPERRD